MGKALLSFVMLIAVIGIVMSVLLLLKNRPIFHGKQLSIRNFVVLLIVYTTVALGFACIYISLELMGIFVLSQGSYQSDSSFTRLLEDAFYFSAATILSVGYGDITPLGIGRWIAMLEAFFGYLLPTAFVVSTVMYFKGGLRAN